MLLIYVILAVLLSVFVAYAIYVIYLKELSPLSRIPSPPYNWLVGHALMLERDGAIFYKQMLEVDQDFGQDGVFVLYLAHRPMVCFTDVENVEKLLSSSVLIDKSIQYETLHRWLGTGLLTASGAEWHSRRKLLTPAFHFNILNEFQSIFSEQADILVELLGHCVGRGPVNIFPYITRCALDIICETAMGKSIQAQQMAAEDDGAHQVSSLNSNYVQAINEVSELLMELNKRPWFSNSQLLYNLFGDGRKMEKVVNVLHSFTKRVITERRAALSAELDAGGTNGVPSGGNRGKLRRAFLDLLLHTTDANGQPLSDDDIRQEVDTFMFEGHDTTAASMTWTLFLLALHPDVQEKVHAELDTVLGDSQRPIDSNDLRQLKLLEAVIKESLRLYPSVFLIGRRLTTDLRLNKDYWFAKGTNVFVLISCLHMKEKYFPRPTEFLPERFLDGSDSDQLRSANAFSYVPFSAGPRNCIGQKFALAEEKTVLASVLRRFRLTTPLTADDVPPAGELISRPHKPVLVELSYK